MGVDYTGNYGIGVKLEDLDFEELNLEDIDCMDEYIEELPNSDNVDTEYFEIGSGSYTGEVNEYYLCIKNPMSDGVDGLKIKVETFKTYLKDNDIKYEGEVDCVGGLHIW